MIGKQHNEAIHVAAELPPLPSGWCWTTVGEVGEVRLGRQRSPNNRSDQYPTKYVRAANLTWTGLDLSDVLDMEFKPSELEAYRLLPGDVLLSEASGSASEVGKPVIWRGEIGDCCFQNTVIRFRPKQMPSDFPFVVFCHFARNGVFSRVAKGVGIHHLSADRFASLPMPLAPLNEQRRIVAKVEELQSDLDAGVAALERTKAKLKRYRAAVLKAAVEGRLTAEWRAQHPATEPASKLLERILAERRKRWEAEQEAKYKGAGKTPPNGWREKYAEPTPPDSATLPALPEGWCWASLGQVALFQNGRAFPSKEYAENGIKLLRPGNLFANGTVQWTEKNTRHMPLDWADKHPDYIVRQHDLVMNLTAQSLADEFLGRTCLTGTDECCLLNQRLARIAPLDGMDKHFALYLLKSPLFRKFVNGLNTGSLIEHMFTSQLSEFFLPLPSYAEQREIVAEIENRLSVVEDHEAQLEANLKRASRLRQSILKRAFEGKLVPQDPQDEPASVLLERLRASRSNHEENEDEGSPPRTRNRRARSIK